MKLEYFVREAADYARSNSDDIHTQTGAVVFDDNGALILSGTNRLTQGVEASEEKLERPAKYKWLEHAERDAIFKAARMGCSLMGLSMAINWYPCVDCARAIVSSGISRLIAIEPDWSDPKYDFDIARQILADGLVQVEFVQREETAA